MKKAILATKVGMTQIFNEDGALTPVTVLQAGPCVVTQIKTVENDGYEAVQVGFVDKKDKAVTKTKMVKRKSSRHGVTKAEKGHFDKAGVSGKRFVREFKFENAAEYALAQERSKLTSSQLATRSTLLQFPKVKDSRARLRDTASTEDLWLTVLNSIVIRVPTVLASDPSKVFKGKEMPGHMGSKQITIQNLEVVRVDAENNLLLVKGCCTGT